MRFSGAKEKGGVEVVATGALRLKAAEPGSRTHTCRHAGTQTQTHGHTHRKTQTQIDTHGHRHRYTDSQIQTQTHHI